MSTNTRQTEWTSEDAKALRTLENERAWLLKARLLNPQKHQRLIALWRKRALCKQRDNIHAFLKLHGVRARRRENATLFLADNAQELVDLLTPLLPTEWNRKDD